MKTLYEATSTAVGARNGHVRSEDGPIDFKLSVPKSMGGDGGEGANPEQLFGAAYAACFGSAIEAVAKNKEVEVNTEEISVAATIGFCKDDDGFFLEATLDCYIPEVSKEVGEDLVNAAHEICPFSKATRDNITVTLNLLLDE
ncbi:organic hydroperoxide resistance protein [Rasiella rasia]|uniref:Organic hydroperoxide resistance protein n=1 Tax=Rasiella rasia TaxID=2744027 RepID=A0A6G6GPW2_9FLAO|nr:organic hydroperoxide resistance protein [Rasiella rasia]QIE60589.1 organic hydroperoxide resistance protein [Rasiella rasia]